MKSRIVIIDDSVFMRTMLRLALQRHADMEVVGEADNGVSGLELIRTRRPAAVTLDIEMPGLTGLEVLDRLFATRRVPVVVVSTKTQRGAQTTLEAMRRGAITCVAKPVGAGSAMQDFQDQVIAALRTALCSNTQAIGDSTTVQRPTRSPASNGVVIAIGISAGGPPTLHKLLPALPADFPPVLITQHMPEAFLPPFARRLDESCAMRVKVAADGDALEQGRILIAPGSHHLRVRRKGRGLAVVLDGGPKVSGFRPSVDVMFSCLAEHAGSKVAAIVLTGMGNDGSKGIVALKQAGAVTLAQDQASSVVYGMPKAARDTGAVDRVVSLDQVPQALAESCAALGESAATR